MDASLVPPPEIIEATISDPVYIFYASLTIVCLTAVIVILSWVGKIVIRLLREMLEKLTDHSITLAEEKVRLQTHIDNSTLHCKGVACKMARSIE